MRRIMGEAAPAMEGKEKAAADEPEPATKRALPPHLRDELFLKFAGTATTILGLVLLVASAIAIGVLSVLKFDLGPWIPILPLSLLLVLVGGLIVVYFRKVIEKTLNPPKPGPPRSPYGFVYPYQMPTAYYRPPMAPPGAVPGAPAPAWGPPQASPAPRPPWRFCIMCGRRIPGEAKFCPYCRHAYTA